MNKMRSSATSGFRPAFSPLPVPYPGWLVVLTLAVFLLGACSQSDPKIVSSSFRLAYRSSGAAISETLSFFVLASDDDGIADLESMYLLNDEAQIFWKLSVDDWLVSERSGETWVGSHALSMPGGAPFPRGTYRAVLMDKGGSRSERPVFLNAPKELRHPYPTFSIGAGRYTAASSWPRNSIATYDASGAILGVENLKAKEGILADLKLGANVVSIALLAEDDENFVTALTPPVKIR